MNKLVIYGCGGHSRSVADVILFNNPGEILTFVDDRAQSLENIFGFEVCKEYKVTKEDRCFLAVGDNLKRRERFNEIPVASLISVISKKAYIGFDSKIGIGCFLAHSCHLGPEVVIGENSIINTRCVVEHEVQVGSFCHIAPNSTISGRVKIEDYVFVGAGATVIDKVKICSFVTVGAGATVTKDITVPGTYIGTPARRIK